MGSDTHYCSGEEIRIHDRDIHGNWRGEVVFVLGSKAFSDGFSADEWNYLGKGFMINCISIGLVFCEGADEDTALVSRE